MAKLPKALIVTRPVSVPDDATAKLEAFAKGESVSAVEASDSLLASLSAMIDRALQLEADLQRIEETRMIHSARLRELVEDLIPAALDESGVSEFRTSTGFKVAIEEVVTATLGKGKDENPAAHEQRVARALEWLDENGHDGIVKVTFDVRLSRGDRASDETVTKALEAAGVYYKRDEGVHHATLAAFVRGQLATGDAVPLDLFRVAQHRRAKIKAPKGQ